MRQVRVLNWLRNIQVCTHNIYDGECAIRAFTPVDVVIIQAEYHCAAEVGRHDPVGLQNENRISHISCCIGNCIVRLECDIEVRV